MTRTMIIGVLLLGAASLTAAEFPVSIEVGPSRDGHYEYSIVNTKDPASARMPCTVAILIRAADGRKLLTKRTTVTNGTTVTEQIPANLIAEGCSIDFLKDLSSDDNPDKAHAAKKVVPYERIRSILFMSPAPSP